MENVGWDPHENYEDAMDRFEAYKEPPEKARRQLERVGEEMIN